MIIDRVFTPGLAQVAYLVADETTGDVAVIDPRRDVQVYLDWAAERGFHISAIFETHVHADFVSGALELHLATGAPVYSSALGNQEFEYRPLQDGDRIPIGTLALEARWTPGHTPEHIVFLLFDSMDSPEPRAMFSGDLIFAGEIGRPDLLGETHTQQLAGQLYETLSQRVADLPDDLTVYPGHTAGSSCGRKIGDAAETTLGAERRFTYAWQYPDGDAFVRGILDEMPMPPPYYPHMKVVNRLGPDLLANRSLGGPMSVDMVADAVRDGATIIDARSTASFDRAQIPGALYAGSGSDFVAWAGWLVAPDSPVVLVLENDADYAAKLVELRRIGFDQILGYLAGGIDAWIDSGKAVDHLTVANPREFQALIHDARDGALVDVRSRAEWKDEHIAGATNAVVGDLASGARINAAPDELVLLTCATGMRSRVAASVLQARGYSHLVQLAGGMNAWIEAGLPVESSTRIPVA